MPTTLSIFRFARAFDREHERDFRRAFLSGAILLAGFVAGCGNFCLVGVSNNGNGTVGVSAGNPPPACSLNQVNGMARVLALKSPACETCTGSVRVAHVFVTLRGIQLHPSSLADADSPDWVELIPALKGEPRQIDLMGGAIPEILSEGTAIPAGNYRQIRLQFLAQGSEAGRGQEFEASGTCGTTQSNCMVMADGAVKPLHFSGPEPEIRISGSGIADGMLVVLPDAKIDLRLRLQPDQVVYSSSQARWELQMELVGSAAAGPQASPE
jgi:Domain of unknown function (DUF4382)